MEGTQGITDVTMLRGYILSNAEHYNRLALAIYKDPQGSTLFSNIRIPLEIFLDAAHPFYWKSIDSLDIMLELHNIFLRHKFNEEQQSFLLRYLIRYYEEDTIHSILGMDESDIDQLEMLLRAEFDRLQAQKELQRKMLYDWNETLKTLDLKQSIDDKISYLIERRTQYDQDYGYRPEGPNFGNNCDQEINKLESLRERLKETDPLGAPCFKWAERRKIDLIRVLNALYELKLIELPNGQIPNKELFMKKTGEFFGVDLSKYDTALSQAMNESTLEVNLKVFQKMLDITQERHYTYLKNKDSK